MKKTLGMRLGGGITVVWARRRTEGESSLSDTIDFNEAAARGLEAAYLTTDVIEQRCQVLRSLGLTPGEHVLDIGSGPALLARDLASTVGETGRVCGYDLSEAMLEMGRRRCADQPWVDFDQGDASKLPYEDESFDVVVSTQVYEYVPDIPGALAEVRRVLRPGGRLAILDTDYDSLVILTEDPARLARILDAWDEHFVHAGLPRTLGAQMRDAGFRLAERIAIPMFNPEYHRNAFSWHLTKMMAGFSAGRREATKEDAQGWLAELEELGRQGRYFYSLNRYLFVGVKR
jgi:ubiquinone/menaquinone biosynthesis C-methylase UbiE